MKAYLVGLGIIIILQVLALLDKLPSFGGLILILFLWSIAFILLLKLSPSHLLLNKQKFLWDIAALSCFFLLSFGAISYSLQLQRDAVLQDPFDTLTFVPADSAELSIPITHDNFSGGALLEASSFARAFGPKSHFFTQNPTFAISGPTQTNNYSLEPIGLNGFVLKFYNLIIDLTKYFVLLGLLLLICLAIWSARFDVLVQSNSLRAILVKILLTIAQILLYGFLLFWFSILIQVKSATLAFLLILFLILLPQNRRIQLLIIAFVKRCKLLFTSVKTLPVGLAGLLVLHLLLDGFKLSGAILSSLAVCCLYVLIGYMWYKTLLIRTLKSHPHTPHLPLWFVALCVGALTGFFFTDTIMHAAIVVSIAVASYFLVKIDLLHRIIMGLLFFCGVVFLTWYAYAFFMSEVALLLPDVVSMFYSGLIGWVLGLWMAIVLLVSVVFAVVGVLSFVYELIRD